MCAAQLGSASGMYEATGAVLWLVQHQWACLRTTSAPKQFCCRVGTHLRRPGYNCKAASEGP
jgi:hypothetical protein